MKAALLRRAEVPALPEQGGLMDYVAVTRPRIALLVLFTVGIGALFAALPGAELAVLFHAVVGTALVAAGASALNQWLERDTDARMERTRNRPLPAGRLAPGTVFAFGLGLATVGVTYLLWLIASPWPAFLAAFTFAAYVAVYTPLKTRTTLNTLIGAVPGAMPPVIGYAAVRGEVNAEALALFVVLFVWQVPHFLAIAWMYREEYASAGLCMLPVLDHDGRATGQQMVLYCIALIPASLLPLLACRSGWLYAAGAVLLGLYFLLSAARFARSPDDGRAKQVLRASLVYLPLLLVLLVLDRLWTVPLF
jgi:protoheme IX farnesyltransferase